MLEKFIDKNGGLNKNWKKLYLSDPTFVDNLSGNYTPKIKLILAIKGLSSLPTCKICGKETEFKTYCSKKCAANDVDIKNKKKQLNSADKNKKISDALKGKSTKKSWETRKKKYKNGFSEQGIENIKNNLSKSKDIIYEKYGVNNPFQIQSVKDKISTRQKENNSSREHLPEWLYDKNKFTSIYNEHGISGIIEQSGCSVNLANVLSADYGIRDKTLSAAEDEIIKYINSLGFTCEKTRKIIPPYELDIWIPEKKIAIEYDGIYWHSSISSDTDKEKASYHLMKTELCEAQGIQLLHIFENEWADFNKREIWKSVIENKLGVSKRIYARKTKLNQVDSKTAKEFCEYNHLQGYVPSKKCIGLFYNNELVQLVTFGKSRYRKDGQELLRMCSKRGFTVIGGASKLLKNEYFISYANRRWSKGGVYSAIGMNLTGTSSPCYFYIKNGQLFHRSSYMKHKLEHKLEHFDSSLTEVENCYNNGLRRIWDCGNLIYEKSLPKEA